MKDHYDLIVTGGGAAGLMAANEAVRLGLFPLILEKNEKAGKKLYITGKGRCNFTNTADFDGMISNINTNPKFMYSSLKAFSNSDVCSFFEEQGLKYKIERGGRIFPQSDRSSDVIKALLKGLEGRSEIMYGTEVKEILSGEEGVRGVRSSSGLFRSENVLVATGGLSYPSTGSTGDGYRFAEAFSINVKDCFPALVPLRIKGHICGKLQGLSLKNVAVDIRHKGKSLFSDFGEMLFTHFGVSGPLILSATGAIRPEHFRENPVLHLDLKPALDEKTLDSRLLRDFSENENRDFANCLNKLLPSKLIPVVVGLSGIDPHKKVNSVTKEERNRLLRTVKDMTFEIEGTRGFEEAVITKGGIDVKELNPKTFEAKKVRGLYFIGETVDVDAMTGGFNLQIAFSSGAAAARAVYQAKMSSRT